MDSSDNVNPWALFQMDDSASKKIGDSTIDNRFPNSFRKYTSLVQCDFCNVILLKNHTQQHFKIHHNKKFKKKFSRFKIPFNAVEGCDLICELRRNKLAASAINRSNKAKDLFKLKHKHSENNFTMMSSKTSSKAIKRPQKESKSSEFVEKISLKPAIISEKSSFHITECTVTNNDIVKTTKKSFTDGKTEPKTVNRKIPKRSILTSSDGNVKRLKSADLKLNIKINSDGLLTSSIKGDDKTCSNIFDRISHFCDQTPGNKDNRSVPTVNPGRGTIKQSGFDESYGCTIFTDEFNNSILIDNDKDEPDDFDCCESSLSNDSAYFSLPNTTSNSITTTHGKSSNLSDFSVAPPLVTAYQYTHSTNKVSYCANDSQSKGPTKSTPMTMHVTRSLSYNSIVPPKSTVKHRFYVSGHSNQTIINTLRRKCNTNSDINFLTDNENDESLVDFQANGILHSLSKENQDTCYFENIKSSSYQNQKQPVNSKSYISGTKDITDNRFWHCFEESGLSVNILIPKRLKWTQSRSRIKSVPQLNIVKTKQSPKNIVPKQQFSRSTVPLQVSENPLLTSYTIDASNIDDVFQSDPLLTSEIVLDYQFPDRNQMSFQQRLLERGVISQRDIARSQRCLSFNINTNSRKNYKTNPIKPNIFDYNRISANQNYPIKNQVLCRTGYNSTNSSSCNLSKMKPTVIQQSSSVMSHDIRANSVPKHVVAHRKPTWNDDINLSRIHNQASTFQAQCLSQNTKYITQDPKITFSPRQNRNNGMSNLSRTLDGRSVGPIFQSASSNSSILHSNNSSFNSILPAQNSFTIDSNRYSQRPIEGQYVHVATNNPNRLYKKTENEFMNYHHTYNDVNPSSMALQSNYQSMYNPQIKFANHSTTIYNANFEL